MKVKKNSIVISMFYKKQFYNDIHTVMFVSRQPYLTTTMVNKARQHI